MDTKSKFVSSFFQGAVIISMTRTGAEANLPGYTTFFVKIVVGVFDLFQRKCTLGYENRTNK